MANSLLDLLQPQQGGQSTDWSNAIGNRANTMMALGMSLLTPTYPSLGQSTWGNALRAVQAGSAADQAAAESAWKKDVAQKQLALEQQRLNQDNYVAGPTITDPNSEMQYPTVIHKRTGQFAFPLGAPPAYATASAAAAPGGPAAPNAPIWKQGGGRVGYLEGGLGDQGFGTGQMGTEPSQPIPYQAAPAAAGPVARQYPPEIANAPPSVRKDYDKKIAERIAAGPTAHEQTSIEKADDAVAANQTAIRALQYAKQISPNAPSGALAPFSDWLGSGVPSLMSPETKNRMLLHNTVATNAVETLRATFGGNPTEGERKILIELQGSVNQPDAVRQEIFDRAIELANRRLAMNQQRAEQIRGQTYYRPGGGQAVQGTTNQSGVRRYNPATGAIE